MTSTSTPTYSTLFSCLYDEAEPIGKLGRGSHYSVFRSVEWLDVVLAPLAKPQIHDFAVVWDEDHDTRVIPVIEDIYMAGLLSPIQFIGERKGTLTVIVAARFFFAGSEADFDSYAKKLQEVVRSSVREDSWPLEIGFFDRQPGSPHQTNLEGLIAADEHRVITYVRNIDSLWELGTKAFTPGRSPGVIPPIPSFRAPA